MRNVQKENKERQPKRLLHLVRNKMIELVSTGPVHYGLIQPHSKIYRNKIALMGRVNEVVHVGDIMFMFHADDVTDMSMKTNHPSSFGSPNRCCR
jgi:hypothetical protein